MANLNFTRNIGGNSLARTSVSFGNNSMSGHVTPVFGQRTSSERRTLPAMGNNNQMGNMNTLGGYSSFNSVFGSGDTNTPSLLDLSEFPSLTNRSSGDNVPQPSPMPGAKPYVGMVKQPTSEASEFTMSSEDFPALPGTQNREGASPGSSTSGDKNVIGGAGDGVSSRDGDKNGSKSGIQTSPDGRVTNIPASMVNDQFGIVGLLTFIRAAETDPNLVSLALGQDLTALGLNLNSPDNLYPTFAGPWAEHPCRPQDIDFHVPPEYLINHAIRDKLASMKLSRYKDDLLFFMFYNNVGDVLQIAAAQELYARDWRYHTEDKVWITQVPGMVLMEKTSVYERGTYYFFDAQNWRKVAKEFYLEYNKLEGRPIMTPNLHHNS
ncbi:CCR4-NOT transcription complex subunit regena isoform X1 [Leptinotarsa decemlineata]|uniref:CCR4-NOT transcription complex subunit regena isoform X1 n=1 Tax=Leptinotarsa decemlineata TaxID=7539 RepID=UPI000C254880|nr:CCR4-NOT transcription complex subunit 2 isoform X1 [Leptinotarsa decemlineata]